MLENTENIFRAASAESLPALVSENSFDSHCTSTSSSSVGSESGVWPLDDAVLGELVAEFVFARLGRHLQLKRVALSGVGVIDVAVRSDLSDGDVIARVIGPRPADFGGLADDERKF